MLQQQQLNPRSYDALIVFVVIIWIVAMLSSCATQSKAERFYNKHPEKLAEKCAEKYPVKETYIPGDTVTVYDSTTRIDTLKDTIISEPKVITEIKKVVVTKVVTKTNTIRDTIKVENTAKTAVLNSQIENCEKKYQELYLKYEQAVKRGDDFRSKYQKTVSWLVLCIVIIGIGTYLKIRKIL
jgi:hypothetical protein